MIYRGFGNEEDQGGECAMNRSRRGCLEGRAGLEWSRFGPNCTGSARDLQEAFGNEAGGPCSQRQTLRRSRRNGIVLVPMGALGCKQSELVWANLSRKGIEKVSGGSQQWSEGLMFPAVV